MARQRDGRAVDSGLPGGFCACPIDAAFASFGKKWSLTIVRNLIRGDRRFNEILEHADGLTAKVLSARLKELESTGLVAKRLVSKNPVRIEYELTEKGIAILPVLRSLARWSLEWAPERVFTNGKAPLKTVEECLDLWQRELVARAARPTVSQA